MLWFLSEGFDVPSIYTNRNTWKHNVLSVFLLDRYSKVEIVVVPIDVAELDERHEQTRAKHRNFEPWYLIPMILDIVDDESEKSTPETSAEHVARSPSQQRAVKTGTRIDKSS